MVWQHASAYPKQIMFALLALTVAALATLAIPAGFRLVIDRGFATGGNSSDIARWFEYLLIIVAVMATATAFREVVSRHLDELEKMSVSKLLDARYSKFRNFGEWESGS